MYRQILRITWRLLTIILVIILALVSSLILFPYLDRRMPIFPAALIVYGLVAYVLLPLISRFWRVVFKPNHIPLYAVTSDGWPADPINIAFVAKNKRQLIRALEKSGWLLADKMNFGTALKLARSFAFDLDYPRAPFSNMYLLGRPFDIGFQKPRGTSASPRTRHHVRLWQLELDKKSIIEHEHFHFWKELLRQFTNRNKKIWIGAAIDDNRPLAIQWRNLQFLHGNNKDTNLERDLIIDDLSKNGLIQQQTTIKAGEPFRFYGQVIGNRFICDGQLKIVSLKKY